MYRDKQIQALTALCKDRLLYTIQYLYCVNGDVDPRIELAVKKSGIIDNDAALSLTTVLHRV